jgi:hypothetical protein
LYPVCVEKTRFAYLVAGKITNPSTSRPPVLSQKQIASLLEKWYKAWNRHDLEQVIELFHNDVVFVHWDGKTIVGKNNLERAWRSWFQNHDNFSFTEIETFIDENQQKALFRWILEWTPPKTVNVEDHLREKREGVDVLHFHENEIIKKLTYSRVLYETVKENRRAKHRHN